MSRKVAFVTGVSRGLGEALAHELLRYDYDVIGMGRQNGPSLMPVSSSRYRFVPVDLSDPVASSAVAEKLFESVKAGGPAEAVLVYNAAAATPIGLMESVDLRETLAGLNVNLVSAILLTQAFFRAFQESAFPTRIVHLSSSSAETPTAGSALYGVAKAGVEKLVAAAAIEAPHAQNKTVCIGFRPGVMEGERQDNLRAYSPEELPSVEQFREFERKGWLRPPAVVAKLLVEELVLKPVDNGRVYNITEYLKYPE